ncbi:MAG TPA: NAD(+) diphosphatase [Spirochaetia bacterium]|nr:NAD(+) diphosphatase [Spirochaetia bacterium]
MSGPSWWFVLKGSDLLVARNAASFDLPCLADPGSLHLPSDRAHVIGTLDGVPCRTLGVERETEAPEGWSFEAVRSLFAMIPEGFFSAAARALEIVDWDRSSRYCGRCGALTALKPGEMAFECTACGGLSYPRLAPAVIVAVVRDRRILLARSRRFPPTMYSVLAGFVEPGETLEECVAREVREETGIEVKNLRYFGSQPWPFPHSLMVAFTAEHASGEIRVDQSEIVDAQWFSADSFPHLPDPVSVARQLINWFAEGPGRVASASEGAS